MKKYKVHTLVLGSGAAGLSAAVRLHSEGISDLLVVSEGLQSGTSINTGSDKQTYYKLGMYGAQSDSLSQLAESYTSGGGMHGDLAMTEAALSARTFFNLVNLGVPFPHDALGQFIGYKTDHDPYRRATSCGPYTSREMCLALIRQLRLLNISVLENRVVLSLLSCPDKNGVNRACGFIAVNRTSGKLEAFQAENVIFAVGGPGGLYDTSVYPMVHTGAIGLALMIGAAARGLPESQFGLASFTDISNRSLPPNSSGPKPAVFRWNVSGTFMQVLPRFISTGQDGSSDPREFLRDFFDSAGEMNSRVFLKGYQWPFDVRKAENGSSLIDLIVYYETAVRKRRVFLDYRSNPVGTDFDKLDPEAKEYLEKSNALFGTPFDRLEKMNPGAVALYRDHGIDLETEPLEIAVCAQHNNGGLAGTIWYESENIRHLFPIGEVNGSHGVVRPGGSALNAGQVGAFRAAEFIAHHYKEPTLGQNDYESSLEDSLRDLLRILGGLRDQPRDWRADRSSFQKRMSEAAAHFRSRTLVQNAVRQAWRQTAELAGSSDCGRIPNDPVLTNSEIENIRNIQLCFAHAAYLDSILFQIDSGAGSRGSSLVTNPTGKPIHSRLPKSWAVQKENPAYKDSALVSIFDINGKYGIKPDGSSRTCSDDGSASDRVRESGKRLFEENVNNDLDEDADLIVGKHRWEKCRPIPESDDWFENVWRDYRENKIFD